MSGFNNQQSLYNVLFQQVANFIQNNANKNQQRNLYWQVMSANNYANQDFDALVRLITMHVELADATRGGVTQQDVFRIIEEWVLQHLCHLVANHREVQQGMTGDAIQQAVAQARNYQTKTYQLERDYAQLQQQQALQQASPMGGFGNQQAPVGGGAFGMFSKPVQPATPSGFQAVQSGFRSALSPQQGRMPAGAADRSSGAVAAPPVVQPQVVQPVAVAPQQPVVQPVEKPVPTCEGPDLTDPRPFDVFRQKGETWTVAHKAPYSLPNGRRYKMFDPNKHILYLVKDAEGNVREEFMELDVESEYLRNEIKQMSPAGVYGGSSAPVVEGQSPRIAKLMSRQQRNYVHPCTEIINQLQTQSELLRGIIMQANAPIVISGKNDAVAHLRVTHLVGSDAVSYNTYITEDPVVIRTGEGLDLLALNRNPAGLGDELKKLREEGKVDKAVIAKLNERLTLMVNTLLEDGMGWRGARIDAFIDDIRDLLSAIGTGRGQNALHDFTHAMRIVIAAALSIDDTIERKRVWCQEAVGVDFNPEKLDVLLFQDVYVMAYANMKVSSIFPGVMPTYTRIDPKDHPHQHELCQSLLDARDENGGVYPAVIMSEDGETAMIVRNPASGDISVRLA